MSDEVPSFEESMTGAQVDAVRIGCMTARLLVEIDRGLSEEEAVNAIMNLEAAQMYLDLARAALKREATTSVHIVRPEPSGIIIP